MTRIGRNDPCPCGSGKKYKKCCLGGPEVAAWAADEARSISKLHLLQGAGPCLMYEDVNKMSTAAIINELRRLGIQLDEQTFLQDVNVYHSARELCDNWLKTHNVAASGRGDEFPWLAAWVLWERLVAHPNWPAETIAITIEIGADCLNEKKVTEACDYWLMAWEAIMHKFQPGVDDLDVLDQRHGNGFCFSDLCDTLELELSNAGLHDSAYFHKRIDFCRRFVLMFPGADDDMLRSMKRAIAESYASLGDYAQAEHEFEQLMRDHPNNFWGYIGWGDMYSAKGEPHKARELYTKAIHVADDSGDADVARDRLADMERDHGRG